MAGPFGFVSYEVVNDEKLARGLDRALKVTKDLRVPFAQIAKDFQKSRKAIFALQSKGGYPDLSTRPFFAWWERDESLKRQYDGGYKEYKAAKYGFAYPILKASGRLERSVTEGSDPENVTRIFPLSMELGTKVPYAEFHQDGRGVPLRKFLFVGPESQQFSDDQIKGFPERALNTLNSFVLRKLGLSVQESTGVTPKVKP